MLKRDFEMLEWIFEYEGPRISVKEQFPADPLPLKYFCY